MAGATLDSLKIDQLSAHVPFSFLIIKRTKYIIVGTVRNKHNVAFLAE